MKANTTKHDQKIKALIELLEIACESLAEHGDEGTLPYLQEQLAKLQQP